MATYITDAGDYPRIARQVVDRVKELFIDRLTAARIAESFDSELQRDTESILGSYFDEVFERLQELEDEKKTLEERVEELEEEIDSLEEELKDRED